MTDMRSATRFVLAALPVVAAMVCATAGGSLAAGVKATESHKAWSVHVMKEKGGKVCYVHSLPVKSSGKYTSRGETYIQVTHRSQPKSVNEISITAGYAYRKGENVDVAIDKKNFSMFTDGDTAWSQNADDDKALVAAMRAGTTMIVKGVSSRGTETTDRYSLAGFTAAYNAIGKACGVK